MPRLTHRQAADDVRSAARARPRSRRDDKRRGRLWVIARSPLIRDARRRQERWTAEVAARRAAAPA
jgi:hypothetical protein